jgi:hypothetical protein
LTPETEEKILFYLATGSQNQNYRSTIMDGEVIVLVARLRAMMAYLDFVGIMMQSTWIDDLAELEKLLPHQSGWGRWIGRHLRNALQCWQPTGVHRWSSPARFSAAVAPRIR